MATPAHLNERYSFIGVFVHWSGVGIIVKALLPETFFTGVAEEYIMGFALHSLDEDFPAISIL